MSKKVVEPVEEAIAKVEEPESAPEAKKRGRRPSVTKKVTELVEKTNAEQAAETAEVVEAKKRGRKPKAAAEEPAAETEENKENTKGKKPLVKAAKAKVAIEHW